MLIIFYLVIHAAQSGRRERGGMLINYLAVNVFRG